MTLPYFFTIDDTNAKVRVDHVMTHVFEFHVQFENGVTDQFLYKKNADAVEKAKQVAGNYDRIKAIEYFEREWERKK